MFFVLFCLTWFGLVSFVWITVQYISTMSVYTFWCLAETLKILKEYDIIFYFHFPVHECEALFTRCSLTQISHEITVFWTSYLSISLNSFAFHWTCSQICKCPLPAAVPFSLKDIWVEVCLLKTLFFHLSGQCPTNCKSREMHFLLFTDKE